MRTKYKIDGASFVTAQDILQELRDTTKIQADKENSNASIGISLVDIGHAVKHQRQISLGLRRISQINEGQKYHGMHANQF